MFKDRADAGAKLASELDRYRDKGVLVLAIPRGGVEVGYQVASRLHADFSILISRKLPYPDNPESGFGAISEDGSRYLVSEGLMNVSLDSIEQIMHHQQIELNRRIEILRRGEPLPPIAGKTVILVDDGIAVGSTMRVSIMLCRNRNAARIIVAVPVAGRNTAKQIAELADEVLVLCSPVPYYAVAQVYENWCDVSDDEVIAILKKWRKARSPVG